MHRHFISLVTLIPKRILNLQQSVVPVSKCRRQCIVGGCSLSHCRVFVKDPCLLHHIVDECELSHRWKGGSVILRSLYLSCVLSSASCHLVPAVTSTLQETSGFISAPDTKTSTPRTLPASTVPCATSPPMCTTCGKLSRNNSRWYQSGYISTVKPTGIWLLLRGGSVAERLACWTQSQ